MSKDVKGITGVIKFGFNNENSLIKIYTYFFIFWAILLFYAVVIDMEGSLIKEFTFTNLIAIPIVYFIFVFPLLLPLWYLKPKRPTTSKPKRDLEKSEPPKKVEITPEPPAPKPEEKQKAPSEGTKTLKTCPSCGGKISELNFFKLKAGNDVVCEFCGDVIESQRN